MIQVFILVFLDVGYLSHVLDVIVHSTIKYYNCDLYNDINNEPRVDCNIRLDRNIIRLTSLCIGLHPHLRINLANHTPIEP